MTVQKMDPETAFVHYFCNQLEDRLRQYRHMMGWYIFSDKRPGTIQERFESDADDYADYVRMFRP